MTIDKLPLLLALYKRVIINSQFLYWINCSTASKSTKYIDESCKFAAAMVIPSLIHRLYFKPDVCFDLKSQALYTYTCFVYIVTCFQVYKLRIYCTNAWILHCKVTSSQVYKLRIYCTNAWILHCKAIRMCYNLFNTKGDVVVWIVLYQHSACWLMNVKLEYWYVVNLTGVPLREIPICRWSIPLIWKD